MRSAADVVRPDPNRHHRFLRTSATLNARIARREQRSITVGRCVTFLAPRTSAWRPLVAFNDAGGAHRYRSPQRPTGSTGADRGSIVYRTVGGVNGGSAVSGFWRFATWATIFVSTPFAFIVALSTFRPPAVLTILM